MEFHQIRYFLAACDTLNFTRAAETCAVSQPALTVAIRKLEDELGGPLFHRDPRQLSLTELGRTMRTHLARVEETRALAGRAAQAVLAPDAGMLDVGVYATVGPRLLAPAIEFFSSRAPDVELVLYDVWGRKAYDLLLSGAFDCAIVARRGPLPNRVEAIPLFTEQMVIGAAATSSLSGRASMPLSELSGHVYLDRLRCEFREPINEMMAREEIVPITRLRSESDAWILHAIAMGDGVTIGPRSVLDTPGVVCIEIEEVRFERQIELVTVPGRALSSAAARFVDCVAGFDWSCHSAA